MISFLIFILFFIANIAYIYSEDFFDKNNPNVLKIEITLDNKPVYFHYTIDGPIGLEDSTITFCEFYNILEENCQSLYKHLETKVLERKKYIFDMKLDEYSTKKDLENSYSSSTSSPKVLYTENDGQFNFSKFPLAVASSVKKNFITQENYESGKKLAENIVSSLIQNLSKLLTKDQLENPNPNKDVIHKFNSFIFIQSDNYDKYNQKSNDQILKLLEKIYISSTNSQVGVIIINFGEPLGNSILTRFPSVLLIETNNDTQLSNEITYEIIRLFSVYTNLITSTTSSPSFNSQNSLNNNLPFSYSPSSCKLTSYGFPIFHFKTLGTEYDSSIDSIDAFQDMLLYYYLNKQNENCNLLNTGYFNVVGVNKISNLLEIIDPNHYKLLNKDLNNALTKAEFYTLGGNYFIATSSYISTLASPLTSNFNNPINSWILSSVNVKVYDHFLDLSYIFNDEKYLKSSYWMYSEPINKICYQPSHGLNPPTFEEFKFYCKSDNKIYFNTLHTTKEGYNNFITKENEKASNNPQLSTKLILKSIGLNIVKIIEDN